MTRIIIAALAAFAVCGAAFAQSVAPLSPVPPPPPPRAKGPALGASVATAQAAIAACLANGYKVTVLIVDSAGDPVVLLSGDGAMLAGQTYAKKKVAAALKYKMPSGDLAVKAKTDAALAAEIKADPAIGFALPGGFPVMSGSELIGAFAVAGAPGGDKDVACASTALAKHPL